MSNVTVFDPSRYQLGKLCRNSHNWNEIGQSLRLKSTNECKQCKSKRNQRVRLKYKKDSTFDGKCEVYYLGKLCPQKHNHEGSGLSLRLNSNRSCKECQTQIQLKRCLVHNKEGQAHYLGLLCKRSHDYQGMGLSLRTGKSLECVECSHQRRIEKADIYRSRDRKRRVGNDAYKAHRNEKRLERREEIALISKRYYQKNREKVLISRKATRGKRKAQKNFLIFGSVTAQTIRDMFEKFGNVCAYCGSGSKLTVDHFIPLASGGTHVESNLVSCCSSCNSRKRTIDPFVWYKRQSFFDQDRWKAILKMLGKTQSTYSQIPLL